MKAIGDGQHTDDSHVFISSSDLSELQSQLERKILTCVSMSQGHLKPNMIQNGTCDPPYLRKEAQTLTLVQYPKSSSIQLHK